MVAAVELILVVQDWIVEFSVDPHAVNDFKPALGQAAQAIGVTTTFDDDDGSRFLPRHIG